MNIVKDSVKSAIGIVLTVSAACVLFGGAALAGSIIGEKIGDVLFPADDK